MTGTDGSYDIQLGSGTDNVTINGNGSNTITGGSGTGNITISGAGNNTINGGAGTANINLSGNGANTLVAGSGAFGMLSVGSSDALVVQGQATAAGDVSNNGDIDVDNSLTIMGTLSGSGQTTIESGAKLEADHIMVGGSPSVSFQDGTGNLIIDASGQTNPSGKDLMTLEDVKVGDTVDIKNFVANYNSLLPEVTSARQTSSTLYVSDNSGKILQFGLADAQANTSFSISSDGSGGTLLTSTKKPSILDLANLSSNVYSPSSIPGWSLVPESGYTQVAAYADPDHSQIVVAVRGTFSFKDVLSDIVSIGEGVVTSSFSNLVSQATRLYDSVKSEFANAAITFTGHSLGGGVAELLGEDTGVQTNVFNAPGIQQIYNTVKNDGLLPSSPAPAANIGPIEDYREPFDWVSATGTQAGGTETIEYPANKSISPITSHLITTVTSGLNGTTTTIKDGYNGFILPVKFISDVVIPVASGSLFGIATAAAGYIVDATLNKFIDPENGSYFTFSQSSGSPQLTSVQFLDNGVAASYKIWANPGAIASAFTIAAPAQSVSLGDGVESFGFEALDANGNPVSLPDGFLLEATYASSGNVSASIESSDIPFFAAALPLCFVSGTLIRTIRGNVAVEDLIAGDLAVTASGMARPIRWLGHRAIQCRSANTMPIRIARGAFGESRPTRDLYLSPGHPIIVGADEDGSGGYLVPIMCLINGTTIERVTVEEVTYWHVELDEHDILLAEGLPVESYIDLGSRPWFDGRRGRALRSRFRVTGHAEPLPAGGDRRASGRSGAASARCGVRDAACWRLCVAGRDVAGLLR